MIRSRILAVLVAGGEECILETVLHEAPVRQRPGQAIEIPRHDDRETVLLEFHYLTEDQLTTLRAGKAAHVVEVGVQMQEGETGARVPEYHPVRGADNPRSPCRGVPVWGLAEPKPVRVEHRKPGGIEEDRVELVGLPVTRPRPQYVSVSG